MMATMRQETETDEQRAAEATPEASPASRLRTSRDEAWAKPVDRVSVTAAAERAPADTVQGRKLSGPLQGFGRMWQKTFRVPLYGATLSPREVIAIWKAEFPAFWPKSAKFYAPLAGIAPGEVALLELKPLPGAPIKLSTGVMVIYADDESFTFMTPEGHTLSAWITFSAFEENGVTVAQAQALERPSDPLDELAYMLGGSKMNDRFWEQTLANLATRLGAGGVPVETQRVCIDKRRQWRQVGNLRHSASIDTMKRTATAPIRAMRRAVKRASDRR